MSVSCSAKNTLLFILDCNIAFGPNHSDVARDWNNLGGAWDAKKDYAQAIKYYEKALKSDLKTFGFVHPNVANRLNIIGIAWMKKDNFNESLKYLNRALTVCEEAGLSHRGPEC